MAAIIATPDDDLPRLVMADRLDELGDPHGEFIRVQCELVRCVHLSRSWPAAIYCSNCGQHSPLRRRERAFLHGNGRPGSTCADWGALPLPGGTSYAPFPDDFRRGFVSRVVLPWELWTRHAAAIRRATPLTHVKLTTLPVDEWELAGPRGDGDVRGARHANISLRHHRQRLGVIQETRRLGRLPGGEADNSQLIVDLLAVEYPGIRFEQGRQG